MMRGVSKRIGSIKFSCLSPDEIRKMSATKIITADTYDDDGFPIDMGLMDPHLGVIEPGLRCKTCGHKVDECPGHFGNIDLAMPVVHVGFMKEIKKLLQSTCRSCGRLLLTEELELDPSPGIRERPRPIGEVMPRLSGSGTKSFRSDPTSCRNPG